ncbi:hypothetical protein BT63DRAFT_457174 [Microthyrium microscopicum]|uniref:Yeast cell wall synthesis Kre9/Knh1-like N-terminal domain-containing protein n=1 Tax=Microthyrium microscopicum TaxID=703497 RepID=A0A6A6U990_9PEZI|nr:hypothetical protein BT63DRAFT_457174 [Microthyrium microscopicum]
MQFKSLLTILATALTLINAEDAPSGNAFAHPDGGEQVPVGKPFTIKWTPSTPGKVSLYLLRGPGNNLQPAGTIVEGIDNTGSYDWTPPTTLENDVTRYGIRLNVVGSSQYQYTMQFGIANANQQKASSDASVVVSSTATTKASASAGPSSSTAANESSRGSVTPIATTSSAPASTTLTTTTAATTTPKSSSSSAPSSTKPGTSTTSAPPAAKSNGAMSHLQLTGAGGYLAAGAAMMALFA